MKNLMYSIFVVFVLSCGLNAAAQTAPESCQDELDLSLVAASSDVPFVNSYELDERRSEPGPDEMDPRDEDDVDAYNPGEF